MSAAREKMEIAKVAKAEKPPVKKPPVKKPPVKEAITGPRVGERVIAVHASNDFYYEATVVELDGEDEHATLNWADKDSSHCVVPYSRILR